jgi:hypothetical protein
MFTWFKNFLGLNSKDESVFVNQIENLETDISAVESVSNSTVDLNSMKKPELLSYAKENGIKVNASMNKDAILNAIKNA